MADIERRESEASYLELLRPHLPSINIRDLAPILVARHIIKSEEMYRLYAESSVEAQSDAFIELLKTKYDWSGALTDALIRNGKSTLARQLMEMQST